MYSWSLVSAVCIFILIFSMASLDSCLCSSSILTSLEVDELLLLLVLLLVLGLEEAVLLPLDLELELVLELELGAGPNPLDF